MPTYNTAVVAPTTTKAPQGLAAGGGNDIFVRTSHGWVSLQGAAGEPGATGPQGVPGGVLGAANYRNATDNQSGTVMTGTGIKPVDPRGAPDTLIDPAGFFTENADFSVTVQDAGWYDVSAQIATTTTQDIMLNIYLGTTSGGYQLGMGQGRGASGSPASAAVAVAVKLTAGQKIFVGASAATGGFSVICRHLSISRTGGTVGPPGPAAPPLTPYVHTQNTAATAWTVTHGLGRFPSITVVDTGGTVLIPDVTYLDNNAVQVTFGLPVSGKAYVN